MKLSTSLVFSARSYPTQDPQCSNHVHGSINAITIHPKQPNEIGNDESEEKEHGKNGSPEDTNTMVHNDEQRDTSQLRPKGTTIDNLGPKRNDDEIEWLDVEEPLDIVNTNGIKEITFKRQVKGLREERILSGEVMTKLSSRVILSEDDYDRGCRKPSDLEDGVYKDTSKLGPEYLTGMDDKGEVT
ncbi:hypothetical protein Tco_0970398 [Tanacetum coccineum]